MAKSRWQDVFDDSGIEQTEKNVEALNKDIQDLIKTIEDYELLNEPLTKEALKRLFNSEFKGDKSKTIQFDSKVITNVIDAFILSKSKT